VFYRYGTNRSEQNFSGNLNIEMEYLDVASGEWKTIRSDKPLFDNNAFWEPGFSQVAYLRIRNAGNLALKR
jgi:hypothetical protein